MNLAVFIKLYPTLEALSRSLLQSSKYFTLSFFHKGTHFIIVLNYCIWITHKCPGTQMSPSFFSLKIESFNILWAFVLPVLQSVTLNSRDVSSSYVSDSNAMQQKFTRKSRRNGSVGKRKQCSKACFCNFFLFFHFNCSCVFIQQVKAVGFAFIGHLVET